MIGIVEIRNGDMENWEFCHVESGNMVHVDKEYFKWNLLTDD